MLDGLHDALGGLAVAVGVDCVRHSGISGLIVEQLACELYDVSLLNTCQLDGTSLNGLRALGLAAQDQNRLPPEVRRSRS